MHRAHSSTPRIEGPIRAVKPRRRCLWWGHTVEIERHAGRTTFGRIIAPSYLADTRIQVKHSTRVEFNGEDAADA